jgi:hypothetical protein
MAGIQPAHQEKRNAKVAGTIGPWGYIGIVPLLTSMRDHLLALQEIDVALSRNEFDKAASIAESRLGVSNDVRPALAALGTVMQQCVACHAAYRLH